MHFYLILKSFNQNIVKNRPLIFFTKTKEKTITFTVYIHAMAAQPDILVILIYLHFSSRVLLSSTIKEILI